MDHFLTIVIALFFLFAIISVSSVFGKKIRIPHTILLFLTGIILMKLKFFFPKIHFLQNIEFSQELVFFIFLPILIFESAFYMPQKKIILDIIPIFALSVFSLLISTFLIGFFFQLILSFFAIKISFSISLLFGSIISATDPVAVLSIFKELGVPKRIIYLFEGESLFNDGTAMALFLIILGILKTGQEFTFLTLFSQIPIFASMILGGVIFGFFMGWLFSEIIGMFKDSWAELTLIFIMAHTTFILSDLISEKFSTIKISAIIATTIASITLGNFGRYKIAKKVREMMETTWGYFAFLSNSLIFLLMGMFIGEMDFYLKFLAIPIFLAILVVVFARIVSVIGVLTPLNFTLKHKIPWNWQKLLAWGSLRGAIAMTMLLFLPDNFSGISCDFPVSTKKFLSAITIACIIFTILFKTLTTKAIIKKMKIGELTKEEKFTLHQMKKIADKSILNKIADFKKDNYFFEDALKNLSKKYKRDNQNEKIAINKEKLGKKELLTVFRKYALGIERNTILKAFESNQVDEKTLKKILNKIENQYLRIEMGLPQTKTEQEKSSKIQRFLKKISNIFNFCTEKKIKQDYLFYRSRLLISKEVIKQLEEFKNNFYSDAICQESINDVLIQYKIWRQLSQKKIVQISDEMGEKIDRLEMKLLENNFISFEEQILQNFEEKQIINRKIESALRQSFKEQKFL